MLFTIGKRVKIVTHNSSYMGHYGTILSAKQWSHGEPYFDLIVRLDNGVIVDSYNSLGYELIKDSSKRKLPKWF